MCVTYVIERKYSMRSLLFRGTVDATSRENRRKEFPWTRGLRFKFPCQQLSTLPKCPWARHRLPNISMGFLEHFSNLNSLTRVTLIGLHPSLHHIAGCYIWRAGGRTVDLLLISGPEIGSLRFPWLLRIWQPFFHGLSTRGTLSPVFLVTVWNWRNSDWGNLSRELGWVGGRCLCCFMRVMCFGALM